MFSHELYWFFCIPKGQKLSKLCGGGLLPPQSGVSGICKLTNTGSIGEPRVFAFACNVQKEQPLAFSAETPPRFILDHIPGLKHPGMRHSSWVQCQCENCDQLWHCSSLRQQACNKICQDKGKSSNTNRGQVPILTLCCGVEWMILDIHELLEAEWEVLNQKQRPYFECRQLLYMMGRYDPILRVNLIRAD